MKVERNDILLVGLPESGKTTFLAALWHLLVSKKIPTALSLGSLPHSREYLNGISGKWGRFFQIDHTPTEEFKEISLQLKDSEVELELNVPDMSGETWSSIWTTRTCAKKIVKLSQASTGLMLFLHAGKIRPSIDIGTNNAMIEALGGVPSDSNVTPWSPEKTPIQVVLVDILQTLAMAPLGNVERRLAVNISAWDKAVELGISPPEFLKKYCPLLHQFLNFGGRFSAVKVFGISAQGGDLHSVEDAKRIKAEDVPSKRILVIDQERTHHDLTEPIKWVIG
ncbi:MAG: hypothetical protein WA705_29145 [Candidatus Ozemobacteraceae bacterium]